MKQRRISNPQRKLAAKVLKCGIHRVWMDPAASAKIGKAITRSDIRGLVADGLIKKLREMERDHFEGRKQRIGSRKGKKGGREQKKARWLREVRPQRKLLAQYRSEGRLASGAYRKVYMLIKGGSFRNKAHLNAYLKENNLIAEKK
ncbi:MAG: 50S ribosomal protein L19e [Candidatus Aenigmatarchaeota archaeon]